MRINKYGIRGLKGVWLKGKLFYFWTPPVSLQKKKVFRHTSLGDDFAVAVQRANDLNGKLRAYLNIDKPDRRLTVVKYMSLAYLLREFEASPKFARYVLETRKRYSSIYRAAEVHLVDGQRMLGTLSVSEITRQLGYSIYEQLVTTHGAGSANETVDACQVAFSYGIQKYVEVQSNPFSTVKKFRLPPRRQRWTDNQLSRFVSKAMEMGYPSVGLCALLCFELVQRPGDMLDLKWNAYQQSEGVWLIHQSKRGVIVRVPETERLRRKLRSIRPRRPNLSLGNQLVCATVTGKRWHRRNFARAARRIAREAGVPDDLQIRDLRRTGATEAASAGATSAEMMAVGGWTNQASIRPYLVQTRDQAAAFQAKRDVYRKRGDHRRRSSKWPRCKN